MKILNQEVTINLPGAILFDIDDTLYNYAPAHAAGSAALKDTFVHELAVTSEDFDKALILARKKVKSRLEGTASSHSRLLYAQKILEILGHGSRINLALEGEDCYWKSFLAHTALFPGVAAFLGHICALKIPCAVVTDLTAQIQFRKLIHLGLENTFDYVITSEEAGYDKPHSSPFELALEKLQIPDALIWMIGDNPAKDIAGARKHLGALTFQKTGTDPLTDSPDHNSDVVFENFNDLDHFLGTLPKRA